ncbi:MAG: polysulfide reductase [Deltaproteobacteria bacterium CG_4_9_14_3_um_filter_63_12]|nr:MAG: polysulfide reductase [Deltaproteobacteria bacterium CG_4_9_14_3_um_filter_63_12]
MRQETLEIVTTRANPLIDPALHVWGWEIPLYLFLGGVVAGLMVVLAGLSLKSTDRPKSKAVQLAPFLSLVLLSVGMGALFLDLSNKLNVYRFYLAFNPTSPMSWGSWILVLVYPVVLVTGLSSLSDELRANLMARGFMQKPSVAKLMRQAFSFADGARRPALWATLGLGIGLGAYTGLLLGTLTARLAWNAAILGPLFLTSGVSTGAALLLLFKLDEAEEKTIVRWDLVAIVVELALLGLMLIDFGVGGAAGELAGASILGGSWTPWFWSVVVIGGLLVPLGLNLIEVNKHVRATLFSPALILLGGLTLRFVLVAIGQESSFSMIQ